MQNPYRIFQSTHPLRGATSPRRHSRFARPYFNPRTPCGVRPKICVAELRILPFQSTHPLRGATFYGVVALRLDLFQSTHPLRGATARATPWLTWGIFQSTHPLRGATSWRLGTTLSIKISIHAPLAGCDTAYFIAFASFLNFNPRTPCGVRQLLLCGLQASLAFQSTHPLRGATRQHLHGGGQLVFQSTHPLRGATSCKTDLSVRLRISIHAPLAGCDPTRPLGRPRPLNFNPRTPCGVRRVAAFSSSVGSGFQSTHPLRGATRHDRTNWPAEAISIHAPLAGCDQLTSSPLRAF